LIEADQVAATRSRRRRNRLRRKHSRSFLPANEVLIDVTVDGPAWLILADAYFPGWKAFTRPPARAKTPRPKRPSCIAELPGVRLEESATVRFKYSPNSVKSARSPPSWGGDVAFLRRAVAWRRVYREDAGASTVQRVAKNSLAPIALTMFNRVMNSPSPP
jgi:hypothetical protein